MEILPKQPSVKGPAEMFTGDVWFDVILKGEEPSRMRANAVHSPPARTPPGIATLSGKPCMSPRASASSNPAAARWL